MPKISLCDGSSSKSNDGSGINVGTLLNTVAVTAACYVVMHYSDKGLSCVYYWWTGEETPEQRQKRVDKEQAEHNKLILMSQRSLALQADEIMRERLFSKGDLTPEENAQLLKYHSERLMRNSRIQHKQLTKATLKEEKEDSSRTVDSIVHEKSADNTSLKDIAGKAR